MPTLARKLRLHHYFALAFGTMIGTGWLVLLDDWLGRGGPLGAMLAYALGGVLLLPVGYVYGQWVLRLPDAAGEAAYTAQVFPPIVSYFTGWTMLLAYLIVCPWEAVAIGKVAAYIFPQLNSFPLYSIDGQPVFLPRLLLGVVLTLFLAAINYRGIRLSATFQNWTTSIVLFLFVLLLAISGVRGSPSNFHPAFSATPLVSILLTLQIVPYFLTGFESVPKCAEEANPEFRGKNYFTAIALALLTGAFFYVFIIAAVAYIHPWQSLIGHRFATAIAFEQGIGARWPVQLILVMALFGLVQCFNGNFVASTRLFFAFARRGTIPPRFAAVHEKFLTPSSAVIALTVATLVALLLGDALLVPVTEVGSMASATGWFLACLSFFLVEKRPTKRAFTALGIAVSLALIAMKVLPVVPGHFTQSEWLALALWLGIGAILRGAALVGSAFRGGPSV
ncbi:MAG TPA: APC family permease [Candidatus Dormibacteraeota bacterium]|nr:APC family permease [Candidatus Dormibacteraeota bacterium]